MDHTPDGTLTFLVIVLLASSWLITVWALGLKADAEQRLALARPQPRHRVRDVTPAPFPGWAFQPQDPTRRAVSMRVPDRPPAPAPVVGVVATWEAPPAPVFVRQASCRPDGTDHVLAAVAAGWDQWNGSRVTSEMRALPPSDTLRLPPVGPIVVAA